MSTQNIYYIVCNTKDVLVKEMPTTNFKRKNKMRKPN